MQLRRAYSFPIATHPDPHGKSQETRKFCQTAVNQIFTGIFSGIYKLLCFRHLRHAKIQGTYFKIQGTYFKIYGLYFLQQAMYFFGTWENGEISTDRRFLACHINPYMYAASSRRRYTVGNIRNTGRRTNDKGTKNPGMPHTRAYPDIRLCKKNLL